MDMVPAQVGHSDMDGLARTDMDIPWTRWTNPGWTTLVLVSPWTDMADDPAVGQLDPAGQRGRMVPGWMPAGRPGSRIIYPPSPQPRTGGHWRWTDHGWFQPGPGSGHSDGTGSIIWTGGHGVADAWYERVTGRTMPAWLGRTG